MKRYFLKLMIVMVIFYLFGIVDLTEAYNLPDTGQNTCYDVPGNIIECPVPGESLAQDGSYLV